MKCHLVLALAVVAAGSASAQISLRSTRAAKAMPADYSEPTCDLKGSHYKTHAAISQLQYALTADQPDKRARELKKATELLLEAIGRNKQTKSSTAWFALARLYLYQGDVVGADSALRLAEAISPKCSGTFEALRYQVWAPLVNSGIEFLKAHADDSALAAFREAVAIHPGKPQPLMSAGVILADRGQTDSAIVYFSRAATAAERAELPEERNQATYNLAAMLQRANRHAAAAAALERYLGWAPNDAAAKEALANSYRSLGRASDAGRLHAEIVAAAPDSSAAGAAPLAHDAAMRTGIDLYGAKRWKEAGEAFERAVAAAPYSRDALYALASCYFALEDDPRLLQTAERLVAIDPMSTDALTLLVAGYQRTRKTDLAVEAATRLLGLRASVAVERLTLAADGATLEGTVTGRAAQSADGKPIAPTPVGVIFEFVDQRSAAVVSQEAAIPALKPGETYALTLRVAGTGIAGWRYRQK